jgi:hypothetical protein
MAYGILSSSTNTGRDSELITRFSTPLSVISNQPAFVSDAASLRRVVSSQNVQRWEIETNLEPTNDSSKFLVHNVRNGYNNIIYIRMPQVYRPASQRLPTTLTLTLSAGAAAGASVINIAGLGSREMVAGEFITIGTTDKKVYLVTDAGSSGTGVGIFPPLNSAKSSGNAVNYGSKVTMQARYDPTMSLGIKYSDGILSDPGSIKLVEAV